MPAKLRKIADGFKIFAIFDPVNNFINKSMKELIEKINAEIENFQKDATAQLEKGNKAAGTRARKASLELTNLFKEFRKASIEFSK